MRKPIIAGNWKLYKTSKEAIELVTLLKRDLCDVDTVDIVVCPVFTALSDVSDTLTESNIRVGAQNLYWEDAGAFTGEVSAPLLKELGVEVYRLTGDSQDRKQRGDVRLDLLELVGDALGAFAGSRGRATDDHGSAHPAERVEQALDACVGCVGATGT